MKRVAGARILTALVLVLGAFVWSQAPNVVGDPASDDVAGPLLSGVDSDSAARFIAAAEADAETAGLVVGHTEPVQVIDSGDGKGPISVRYINYDAMQAFTIFVDARTGKVVGHKLDKDWPDYSPAERALGSAIALADPDTLRIRKDWVVDNITGSTGLGKCLERRCIVVMLTPPDGSYLELRLLVVDLGLRKVVEVEAGK